MAKQKIYAGTSGYSYPEWKGSFYPADLPQKGFLEYYADRFSTVEINNTFYRFPRSSLLEGWRDGTPDGFIFSVKANQGITHRGRLRDVEELTRDFVERCKLLGDKLGPILFQLPPNFKRDDERLADFADILDPRLRYAFEFRHPSWFDESVFELLSGSGFGLCVSEGEKLETPRVATGKFAYIRLRKDDYSDADLADWHDWMERQTREGREVFAYLKHDEAGESPEYALRLLAGG
ncbi:MAG: DUF72 domain-containing protein [Gemmatimonadetes bacterium]|uniref:DUF72 domain-containing protein n=1 Tax=Candidatus Kutchimonas denitrificans TaxID=3056748 RepID=A0AAE4Z894_9BACT|nr:DUF72 domain-containing protein [Gemmatimonadota bacterium]NIR74001.1 DUF72 domain-containing protein [Candidatus Kutchimonas denitrificans]NIS02990.1 DUF72 domain-containing protein [Gemmatimonadota bacterium]NIT68707.1 DUF72 domain-containing protein [Gemmatimonadota bacterium]NIU53288.1 DUF72 domain-containing protein [Gemmatimonadota bacterium]